MPFLIAVVPWILLVAILALVALWEELRRQDEDKKNGAERKDP